MTQVLFTFLADGIRQQLKMPVTTRSGGTRDWRQLLALPTTSGRQASSASQQEYEKKLEKLSNLPAIPKTSDRVSQGQRKRQRLENGGELLDTSSYPPTLTPDGFGLLLLPHQQRGLSWMLEVENEARPIYVHQEGADPSRIFGGILADRPGTGKSVLMIALMKLRPCTYFFQNENQRTRSKATLLLCPRNIVLQWAQEFHKCDPGMKVLQITTPSKLKLISSLEVSLADVIILPYYLLADPGYITNARNVEALKPPALTSYQELVGYRGLLTRFHFQRIVYDEVHEIYEQTRGGGADCEFVTFMEKFHSNWRWGLTGTLPKDAKDFAAVLKCIAGTGGDLSENAANQLRCQIVRSNNPDLGIPGISQEVKWVDLSPQEVALYNLFRNSTIDVQLMACSHFNVNQVPVHGLDLAEGLTLEQVSEKLQAEHKKQLEFMANKELPEAEEKVPKLEERLENLNARLLGETDREAREELRGKIGRIKAKLRTAERVISKVT